MLGLRSGRARRAAYHEQHRGGRGDRNGRLPPAPARVPLPDGPADLGHLPPAFLAVGDVRDRQDTLFGRRRPIDVARDLFRCQMSHFLRIGHRVPFQTGASL